MKKPETIKEVLGQLAGAASLCWSEIPKGVFDSVQAQKFVDEAESQIIALIEEEFKDDYK